MEVKLPQRIAYFAEGKKIHLMAGTFSGGTEDVRPRYWMNPDNPSKIVEYKIYFDEHVNGQGRGQRTYSVGSMDMRQLTQSNQLVLIAVDLPASDGTVTRYFAGAWAPDGGQGRYLLETDNYFTEKWMVSKVTKSVEKTVWKGLAMWSVLSCLLLIFLNFVGAIISGYLYYKWIKNKKSNLQSNGVVFGDDLLNELNMWIQGMMRDGTFQRHYLNSFGIQMGGSERL